MKSFGWIGAMVVASCSAAPPEVDFGEHFLTSKLRSGAASIQAAALAIDPERNYYLACHFKDGRVGTNVFSSSYKCDLFLAKYDQQTNCLWVRQIGNASSGKVAVHGTDAVFIAGWLHGDTTVGKMAVQGRGKEDIFLAKYDPEGNLLWFKQAGGPEVDIATGVAVDPAGNSYITGEFRGPARFDSVTLAPQALNGRNWSCDFFVAKYDPAGKLLWVKRDADGFTAAQGIGVDAAGNIYVTGSFFDPLTFGTHTIKSPDMFLFKYDTDGNFLWAQAPGGKPWRYGHNVAVDAHSNPYVVGIIQNTVEFGSTNFVVVDPVAHVNIFLAKYSAAGEFQWVRQFRNGDADFSNVVSLESVGVKRPLSLAAGVKPEAFAPLALELKAKAIGTHLNVASVTTPTLRSTQSPVLKVQKSGDFVVLFWSKEFAGFVLEGSETITPFPVWEPVSDLPESIDDQVAVAIPIRDTAKFYRLRRP